MKSIYKFLLLLLLWQTFILQSKADSDAERVFRPITAANGLADNSAQTMKCTFTGRMTITTLGNINFYDGANFSQINSDTEVKYKLEDYNGHYHLYFDNNHHLWLKNKYEVSCVDLNRESYITNIDSLFALYGAKDRVNDMFVDGNGDLWLCEGHYVLSAKYRKKVRLPKGVSLQELAVFDKKQLFLFYDNGLLKCYDLERGRLLYQNNPLAPEDRDQFRRSCVQITHDGNIYLIRNSDGDYGAILLRYDVSRREWKELLRSEYHLNNMVVNSGKLYLAAALGYMTMNLETGEVVHYKTLTLDNGRQLETDVNTLEFDLQGGLWIGTEKRGLLYDSPVHTNFTALTWQNPLAVKYGEMMYPLQGIKEFKGKKANMMFVDSRRWTWVATPNGLQLYTSPQAEPMLFSQKNGLLNNVIHSIIEDDMHNIWASTSCGICCVYLKNNVIKQVFSFSRDDNVPNETFVDAKVLKLDNGQIVMQAIDHVVTFQPAEFLPFFEQEAYSMQTKLTKLMVNGIDVTAGGKVNGDVVLEKAITRTKEIDLNYDQNSISMTFSALNFARPLQTFYRVRVRELSPNWREFSYFDSKGMVDSKGLLHLPLLALEAGTYHVEVQASVVKGKFVGTPYEWIVNVNQPWWRTTGIMAVFGLIVLALAVLNVLIFNRNTRLRMKRNNEEGDVIRRIKVFVERCENFSSDKLSPTQEEIYGTDKDSQVEVSNEFVEVMLKVIPFVQERNGRPFSMYMLSKVTDMELRDLYEMVLDNIYKSPRALIRSMRIDQVADQLLTTDKTIEDIATDCGFVSPNYMIAKFFHKYRMTPAEYREEYSE